MPNLRIISNNAIDRATLSASTTAGNLAVANLKTDIKSKVWRSTATSATITATWTAGEYISGVALPFCNLTPTATIQVEGYTEVADVVPVFNTGILLASPFLALDSWAGVNSFSHGGGTYGRAWVASPAVVKKLVVYITDTANTAGYVEAGRLVAGQYWEPRIGAVEGATLQVVDTSKHFRTEAGDLMTDVGTRHRKQSFQLPSLDETDRARMWEILWANGLTKPIFLSMYPGHADTRLEQTHQLYGKLVVTPIMGTPYFNRQNATLEIEEI